MKLLQNSLGLLQFLALGLVTDTAGAQQWYVPYELERYPPSVYAQEQQPPLEELSAAELLPAYMQHFKARRSEAPSRYFPEPDVRSTALSNRIATLALPGKWLVAYLESGGSASAGKDLLSSSDDTLRAALPYAAVISSSLQQVALEAKYLQEMRDRGMLSPVLLAFGFNALLSVPEGAVLYTQGMQDLLAVRYAMLQQERSAPVYNRFLEKHYGLGPPVVVQGRMAWAVPTMTPDFYRSTGAQTLHCGMGALWLVDSDLPPPAAVLRERLAATLNDFHGLGADAESPADGGLLQAYAYLIDAAEAAELSKDEQETLDTLRHYLAEALRK